MNTFFAAVAIFATSICSASTTPQNVLSEDSAHHTPFERLEHAYNHGTAARLSDFQGFDGNGPLLNTRGMKCTNDVTTESTRQTVAVRDEILMLVTGKVVAGQATPDVGPLFPGHPQHDEFRQGVMWGTVGGVNTPEELGAILFQGHYEMCQTDDELSQTTGTVRKSWRMHEGLLVEQDATLNDKGEVTGVTSYSYCWFADHN